MTQNETFIKEALQLQSAGNYTGISLLTETQGIDYHSFRIFLKRAKKITDDSNFWKSNLPIIHAKELFSSDIGIEFINAYFSIGDNCNHDLNKLLYNWDKPFFIKHYKVGNAWLQANFIESLNTLSTHPDLELMYLQLNTRYIQAINQDNQQKKRKLISSWNQIPIDKIFIGITKYYQTIKQQLPVNDKRTQVSIEYRLCLILEEVIKAYIVSNNRIPFEFNNAEDFNNEWFRQEPEHWLRGKKYPFELFDKHYEQIVQLIENTILIQERDEIIDCYRTGLAEFINPAQTPSILESTEEMIRYKFNDNKDYYEEFYFQDTDQSFEDLIQLSSSIKMNLNSLAFYGIVNEVWLDKNGNQKINIQNLLTVLISFSKYKGPIHQFPVTKETLDRFGKPCPVQAFSSDSMVKVISEHLNISQLDSRDLLNFLSIDMQNPYPPNSIFYRPFLRNKDTIYWLGSFMMDRKWSNIILNKLIDEPVYFPGQGKIYSQFSKNLESVIANRFNKAGFKAWSGISFKSNDGVSGDIDVLAIKGNSIIIVEVKSSKKIEGIHTAKFREEIRLEGTAVEQLFKIENYLINNWTDFLNKTNLSLPQSCENLTITKIIITNYFEGDLRLYKNRVLKASLIELDVILNNQLEKLIDPKIGAFSLHDLNAMINSNNPHIKNKPQSKNTTSSLWKDTKVETSDIVECIIHNKIWGFIKDLWKFPKAKLVLK